MMKKIAIAAMLSAVLISSAAFADDSGFFGAIDAQSWKSSGPSGTVNPASGLRIGGGYNFTQNWGVEADYAQSGTRAVNNAGNFSASALQVAGVGTYPINDLFGVYGKLGLSSNKLTGNAVNACTKCSATGVLYGVGGVYNVNKKIGVRLEYLKDGNITGSGGAGNPSIAISTSTLSLGAIYRF